MLWRESLRALALVGLCTQYAGAYPIDEVEDIVDAPDTVTQDQNACPDLCDKAYIKAWKERHPKGELSPCDLAKLDRPAYTDQDGEDPPLELRQCGELNVRDGDFAGSDEEEKEKEKEEEKEEKEDGEEDEKENEKENEQENEQEEEDNDDDDGNDSKTDATKGHYVVGEQSPHRNETLRRRSNPLPHSDALDYPNPLDKDHNPKDTEPVPSIRNKRPKREPSNGNSKQCIAGAHARERLEYVHKGDLPGGTAALANALRELSNHLKAEGGSSSSGTDFPCQDRTAEWNDKGIAARAFLGAGFAKETLDSAIAALVTAAQTKPMGSFAQICQPGSPKRRILGIAVLSADSADRVKELAYEWERGECHVASPSGTSSSVEIDVRNTQPFFQPGKRAVVLRNATSIRALNKTEVVAAAAAAVRKATTVKWNMTLPVASSRKALAAAAAAAPSRERRIKLVQLVEPFWNTTSSS
ncbi:hypothetical protein AAL_02177 [Moelleriella libera RCEF 2490]|uniref:Uncharacterized protein n=1 Tax=Moelleriella libera RCEF 2490 TaxID=1081109 RepID=A0A168F8X5_9HYPO|nr:hypothetical protein AAL_02177 [Moelleriella libera RCEF 2490]